MSTKFIKASTEAEESNNRNEETLDMSQIDSLLADPDLRPVASSQTHSLNLNEKSSAQHKEEPKDLEHETKSSISRLVQFIKKQSTSKSQSTKKSIAIQKYIEQTSPTQDEVEKGLQLKKTA